MVAGDVDVVADGVLGGDHGVHVIVEEQLGGVCLDGVACIHHQGGLGAGFLDGGGLLGHAAGGILLVGGVIPGVKLAVGVAGGQDLQIHAPQVLDVTGRCRRGQTADRGSRCGSARDAQEITAGNLILFHKIFLSFLLWIRSSRASVP